MKEIVMEKDKVNETESTVNVEGGNNNEIIS